MKEAFCLHVTIKEKAPQVEAEQIHHGAESGAEVRAGGGLLSINGLTSSVRYFNFTGLPF